MQLDYLPKQVLLKSYPWNHSIFDCHILHLKISKSTANFYSRKVERQPITYGLSFHLLILQIGAFILNWVIWIAARLVWEFAYCSDEPDQSKTHGLFIFVLIILQCTGPRLECILLS